MFNIGKYVDEFVAFLFFLVVFVWVLRNASEFNSVLTGVSNVYISTFQGLTKGSGS